MLGKNDWDGYEHCAVGALEVATAELGLSNRQQGDAQYALSDYLGGGSITGWNDTLGRTEDEVREGLLMAAKDLRNSVNHE